MDPSRRFVALARDVTERVGADRRVLTAIKEKDRLLQELHHRVKNNMQVIISLLSLKARKSRSTLVKEAIQESQNRIYAMALVHESLHGAGQPIGLGVQVYVQRLAQYLINLYQGPETGIQLTIEVPGNFELGVDQAIPCGLILNELLTNALKYAFVGRDRGEIRLGARVDEDGRARIWVHDDGVGLPEGLDWLKTDTLGLSLVRNLAISQLKGEFRREPSPGTHFTLVF
jgi:two-component sensor histidine kinase